MNLVRRVLVLFAAVTIAGCTNESSTGPAASAAAETIYFGGPILTMAGDEPTYAEAVAVRDGRILFVGARQEAMAWQGDATRLVDLDGRVLLPGFMDGHGHAWMAGFQRSVANLLPPPDGEGTDIAALMRILKNWAEENPAFVEQTGWIVGFGYDDAQLAEKRHPVASEIDFASLDRPVLLVHQSGHLAALNHKALEITGISSDSPNPDGGVIRREGDGRTPNGVLEETATYAPMYAVFGRFDDAANERLARAGLSAYAEFGYTTAQEGGATADIIATWQRLARASALPIDVVAYPYQQPGLEYLESQGDQAVQANYANGFRVGGLKLSLDGSPQGKTAWLTKPYKVPPPGQPEDYAGYPIYRDDAVVDGMVERAYERGWQVLAHCNGDAAADQFINAVDKAVAKLGGEGRRDVMIHAQTVREDQLDRMRDLGIMPSFFTMHTYYWGDWHRDETLGKERAYRISPTASTLQRGMRFTAHHDAPVALPSSIMILHTTVNRRSRTGELIGADQRVSPYVALKSLTEWAAYQYFEEDEKGTIETGKVADFVILDKDPLAVDPLSLKDLHVVETIKRGVTVYRAESDADT